MADEKPELDDDASEPEEDLEPEPSPESASEEPEDEAEPEEAPKWRRVRDDLYRRQSQVERAIGELKGLMEQSLRAGREPQPGSVPRDPTLERLKLQQDPRAFVTDVVRESLAESETRVTQKLKGDSRAEEAQRSLKKDFPEIQDQAHPFFEVADRIYTELVEQEGLPKGPQTALIAAKLADRERPELREKNLKERRKRVVENGTRSSLAEGARLDTGAPKPRGKREAEDLPKLTREDYELAKKWKVNLDDPKESEWIRREKARLSKLRLDLPKGPPTE